ncbi:transcriptional regulator ATRX-like isoform X2 [Armigeres subalbatus]|uniref:transcriptional regulator ATRX-like isoform X2 n=1 Tax=Armigeres subalbatus TaxID=124917 RepID=UPI002ED0DA07
MGSKQKVNAKNRGSRRQLRSTRPAPLPPPAEWSTDESERGVTPTPSSGSCKRRRPLRKRMPVWESSDDTAAENSKSKADDGDDSDSSAGDNPVARMLEISRLPLMIMEVRKLSEEIGKVCDELEKTITSDSPDQDIMLDKLKKKLLDLTQKCYRKVVPASEETDLSTKKADKSQSKHAEFRRTNSTKLISKKRIKRSNSVDYTEYCSKPEPEKSQELMEAIPADESTTKDSGNPSSGHDESVATMKTSEDVIHSSVELQSHSAIPLHDECEPSREDQNNDMTETCHDLATDVVKALVTCNYDSQQFNSLTLEAPLPDECEPIREDLNNDKAKPCSDLAAYVVEALVTCNYDSQQFNSLTLAASLPDECEPIREDQNNDKTKTCSDLSADVEAPVTSYYDSQQFNNLSLSREDDGIDQIKKENNSKSDKEEVSVINDDIFGFHNYATPQRRLSNHPPAVSETVKQEIKKEALDYQKQHIVYTPTGTRPTPKGKLIIGAKPNVIVFSSTTEKDLIQESGTTDTKPEYLYQAEPSTSKNFNVKLIPKANENDGSKFITAADPNPNREPTNDEIRYIVPHLPKFSVSQVPQGENYELSLMKREIEQRLRVNDLSYVTQRAIRDETSRVKKVDRNNHRLEQEMARFGGSVPANQLILDYEPERKTFIRVHPELVAKMKPHQKEGVKFMYDCCYGGSFEGRSAGSGCILAHCMGLGKTMQVIALMNTVICYPQLNTKRIIVVCPKSTVMNWAQEIRFWLGDIPSGVAVQTFYMPDNSNIYKKLEVLRGFYNVTNKNAHCLVIGYEAFRSLVFYDARNKNGEQHSERIRTEVRRILINPGADLIVLDEGHIIKNRKSQTNLSVSEVATKRRIILTGTPIQNNLNEYFCMVSFVKPAYLGNEKEFNEQYAKPIKDGQHKDSSVSDIRYMKMKSFILHKRLTSFVQRKEFTVLEDFLPEKYEYVLYVPLTPVQEDLYEQYLKRNPFRKDVGGRNLLEDYTFMRKIWTHPIVLEKAFETAMKKKYGIKEKRKAVRRVRGFDSSSEDDDDNEADNARSITNIWWKQIISKDDLESLFPSNKMLLLFEILRMCQEKGEKCLIFSGFVMVLNMVEHFMKMIDEQNKNPKAHLYGFSRFRGPWRPGMDYYRLDGGTSKSIRHEMITKFNDPKNRVTRVFLISTKAGGQGINLVGANRVVILDTSWNPAVDQQGIFRIYRLGQQKPCYIYRLLAIHTMEEKVYSRAVTKQAMSHRVADKKQVDRNYNMAELEELYHFERVNMSARPIPPPAVDDLLSTLLLNFPKFIFRYHMHETMLDNKTEKDLTDFEKQLAWNEFKKKGLELNLDFGMGEIGKTDSQLSEIDVDLDLRDLFEKSCEPKIESSISEAVDNKPLIIPARQLTNENSKHVDPKTTNTDVAIFGEDPYNEISLGCSIIEEQRKKLGIKSEQRKSMLSQVTVSNAEVELLRTLEDQKSTPLTSVEIIPKPHGCDIDTEDILNLSYESGTSVPSSLPTMTEPSSVFIGASLSSMIEYDPITSSQDHFVTESCTNSYRESMGSTNASVGETSTYEKFEACLKADPKVVTSTVAPPPSLVLVATATGDFQVEVQMHGETSKASISMEPLLTRSMKRKMMAMSSSAAKPKKAKINR